MMSARLRSATLAVGGLVFALSFGNADGTRLLLAADPANTELSNTRMASMKTTRIERAVDRALQDSLWFDAERDRVQPVWVTPSSDDSLNRSSRWLPKPRRIKQSTSAAPTAGGALGGLTFANLAGWILLAIVVVAAVAVVAYLMSRAEAPRFGPSPTAAGSRRSGPSDQQIRERLKHLPVELRRSGVDARSEAERLMRLGQFDSAVILLFAHQLLLLDHAGLLRLSRGKTNRRYVVETGSVDRQASDLLRRTVEAFERSYFGLHSIGELEFDRLWRDNATLEAAAQRQTEAAA